MQQRPWVSFCISTFKRPGFLQQQLALLLQQTFSNFEIVISDNDPDASGKTIAESFNDKRISYFHNEENLGMIKSFNKSIDRATADYIVMVTDDDPVDLNFLSDFHSLFLKYPSHSAYCGFIRAKGAGTGPEIITGPNFLPEILDPGKTPNFLWSSCILRREDVLAIGKTPDYGSPHLADHAMLVMAGSKQGAVVVNKMYSTLSSHDTNFSKTNFNYYLQGCTGFYNTLMEFCKNDPRQQRKMAIVIKHLGWWFITCYFMLKRYYVVKNKNTDRIKELDEFAGNVLRLPFMRKFSTRFALKQAIFSIKRALGLLK